MELETHQKTRGKGRDQTIKAVPDQADGRGFSFTESALSLFKMQGPSVEVSKVYWITYSGKLEKCVKSTSQCLCKIRTLLCIFFMLIGT